jgi:hypothetical protein
MQWVESLFGASPDQGDGSIERMIAVGVVSVAVIAVAALFSARRLSWRRLR